MFNLKNFFYLQVHKINCRLANRVLIIQGTPTILNLAFSIKKNNLREEFNYQYELKNKRMTNELRKYGEIKLEKGGGLWILPVTQILNY